MKKVILTAMVLVLAIAGTSFADQGEFGPGMKRGGMIPPGPWWENEKVAESLAITDEEKVKFETLFYEHRKGMIDLRGAVRKAKLELEHLMRSKGFTAEAGLKGFDQLQDALTALGKERFNYVIAVRELLGVDRYKKLKAELRKFRREAKQGRRMAYMPARDDN